MPVIVNNRVAYPIVNEGDNIVYSNYPLFNTQAPFKIDNKVVNGNNKFCNILATGFNTTGEINCTDDYDTNEFPEFKKSFETQDGVQYMIQTTSEKKDEKAVYQSNIIIDVDGEKGLNCFAAEDNCKDPDRFKLMVSSDGVIKIGDPLAQHFIETRTNWKLNRDLSTTGDMIADLDIDDKEKILEFLPEDEGAVDTPKWFGEPFRSCKGSVGASVDGLAVNCIQSGFYNTTTGEATDANSVGDKRGDYIILAVADFPVADDVYWFSIGSGNPIGCKIPAGGTYCEAKTTAWGSPLDISNVTYFNNGSYVTGYMASGASQLYVMPGDGVINRDTVTPTKSEFGCYYRGDIDDFNNKNNYAKEYQLY